MNADQWARCRAWLRPALREDTEEHVLQELWANRAQLWPGERSAMVTQLLKGEERMIHVWLAGGCLAELLEMRPGVEAWARAQGAQAAWINGRKGWARVLARRGFEPRGTELRKPL